MDNETGIAIARQLAALNANLEKLNGHHESLLKLQGYRLDELRQELDDQGGGTLCGYCKKSEADCRC